MLTPWHRWIYLHHRTLDAYGFAPRCAAVRALDTEPESELAITGKTAIAARAEMEHDKTFLTRLEHAANAAVDVDGADVIVLGSATMDSACAYLRERSR